MLLSDNDLNQPTKYAAMKYQQEFYHHLPHCSSHNSYSVSMFVLLLCHFSLMQEQWNCEWFGWSLLYMLIGLTFS